MAAGVGAETIDRLFASVEVAEVEGDILCVPRSSLVALSLP